MEDQKYRDEEDLPDKLESLKSKQICSSLDLCEDVLLCSGLFEGVSHLHGLLSEPLYLFICLQSSDTSRVQRFIFLCGNGRLL